MLLEGAPMKFAKRASKSAFSTVYVSDEAPTPDQMVWLEEVFSLGNPEFNTLVNDAVGYLNRPDSGGVVHLSFYGSKTAVGKLLSLIEEQINVVTEE